MSDSVVPIFEIETLVATGEAECRLDFAVEDGHLSLLIGGRRFSIGRAQKDLNSQFVALYQHDVGDDLNVHNMAAAISSEMASLIPEDLAINLEDALFAFSSAGGNGLLIALHVGTDISLSNLPLVGQKLSGTQAISITGLQLLVASKKFTLDAVKQLNTVIDEVEKAANGRGFLRLPESDLSVGCSLLATLKFGASAPVLQASVASETPPNQNPGEPKPSALTPPANTTRAASAGLIKWLPVQKSFGPIRFERVGVQYENRAFWFLLDASLSAAGLTISLDGLAVGSELGHFAPQFRLAGLGLDYKGGGVVEIGGAFLRIAGTDGNPDIFNGSALIKTKTVTISGLGSYAELDGHPSLFVYAFLNYPLGGPAFFFVTGLAAGFGYNRKLIVPAIENVGDFPLVREALGHDTPEGLEKELVKLQEYVPPAIGQSFLAVGLKFTTFKLIDSFALLTIEFGSRVVFNILGLSTAIVPTPEAGNSVTPLAEVQMAWKATFDPDEGFLGLSAQLTANSYILSHDCHLTGGFAFYSWFSGEHAGDFVHTMGGYHPAFNVPAHYPRVPRLQFNWRVTSNLTLKGDAYYALCGSALMAGGHLDATWESGDLKAWFKAGADFLIQWKPYHYDASIYVDVGVSYTFKINLLFTSIRVTISVDVGADLHIWGPDFSGHARVHLWIITFGISFGADASQEPLPIDWDTFRDSFLPVFKRDGKTEDKICSISVKDGLVREMREDGERWIINPKHFSLVTNSAIPFTVLNINSTSDVRIDRIYYTVEEAKEKTLPFSLTSETDRTVLQGQADKSKTIAAPAIGSMDVKADQLTSTHTIKITRDGDSAEFDFLYRPILKRVPVGLWGESRKPDLNGEHFIENALTGFEITPKKKPTPCETAPIDRDKLQFSTRTLRAAYSLRQFKGFVAAADSPIKIDDSIKSNAQRDKILESLGYVLKETVRFENMHSKVFLVAPAIGSFKD